MNENKKGYWVYSVCVVTAVICLLAYFGYLVYDLVLKLAEKDFSNNTVVQALITLIITTSLFNDFVDCLQKNIVK